MSSIKLGLLPLGGEEMNSGYKGYALGMFVELITSIMSGGAVAHNVRSWTTYDKEANLGQCFAAINPDMFCPNLPERLQELMDHLRKLEPVDSTKPILVPGDPERMSQSFVEEKQNGAILYTSNPEVVGTEFPNPKDLPIRVFGQWLCLATLLFGGDNFRQ